MKMCPFLWITLPYPLLCPVSSLWSLGGAATLCQADLGQVRLLAEAMGPGPRTWLRTPRDYGIGVTGWETLGREKPQYQVKTT